MLTLYKFDIFDKLHVMDVNEIRREILPRKPI